MKMNLRNSLAHVCIAATALSSFAAEPERIVRTRVELNVTPVPLPAPKPSERRGLTIANNPPQQSEVQPIADKLDELINALRR